MAAFLTRVFDPVGPTSVRVLPTTSGLPGGAGTDQVGLRNGQANGQGVATTLVFGRPASSFVTEGGSGMRRIVIEEARRADGLGGSLPEVLTTSFIATARRLLTSRMAGIRRFAIQARQGTATPIGSAIVPRIIGSLFRGRRRRAGLCRPSSGT